ncbi:MAG: hypothetical protein JWN40_5853 [Phycisphaerales bacterium]|nr:hypothetical protein [Phycisphaerales bacterium]
MKMTKSNSTRILLAACAAALTTASQSAIAATITWNGGGADNNWSTGANWIGGAAPLPADALIFAGVARLAPIDDFPAGTRFSGITFSSGSGAFTLGPSANTIALGGGDVGGSTVGNFTSFGIVNGVTNSSTNLQTVNLGLTLNVGLHTFGGGAGGLVLGGPLTHNPGGVATFTPGAGGITATGVSNSNGILGGWATLAGTDWATRDANNKIVAYTAYTDVAGGAAIASAAATNVRISVTNGSNVTLAAAGVTDINSLHYSAINFTQILDVGANNTLRLGASGGILRSANSNNSLTIGASTAAGGTLTAGGPDAAGGGIDNNPGELVFNTGPTGNTNTAIKVNSKITDNGTGAVRLIKTGLGTLDLSNANSYTGGTYVADGRIATNNPGALGTGPVTVIGLGQVFFGVGGTYVNDFSIAGIGTNEAGGHGALRLNSNSTLTGAITLLGNARIATRSGTGFLNGKITGGFALELGGYNNDATNTVVLNNTANDWTGNTTFSEAQTIRLGASEVIPNGAGKGNVALNTSASVLRNTVFDLNGFNETVNGFSRTGATRARAFVRNNLTGTAATLTVGDNDQSSAFDGNIQDNQGGTLTGTIALTKIGAGTLTLAGANTYSGGTIVNKGILLANGAAVPAATLNATTTAASAVVNGLASTAGLLVGQPVSGTGIPIGAVITVINTANQVTLSANATVAGTPDLTFAAVSALGKGNVSVASGAGFGGVGTLTSDVTLAAGSTLRPGATTVSGAVGTLTLNNLTINGGDLQFDLVASANADFVHALGTINFAGPSTITPIALSSGTYTLFSSDANPIIYAAGAVPTLNSAPIGDTRPANYVLDTTTNPSAILLNVTGGGTASLIWAGNASANWNVATDVNWKNGVAPDKFYRQDTVTFDDTATNPGVVQLVGQLIPTAISVNAARDYTFAGSGGISGATGISKAGTGTLTLANSGVNDFTGPITIDGGAIILANSGNNSFNGGIRINAGALQVGNGGTVGNLPTVAVTNTGNLIFNRSDTITYAGVLSGTGNLEQRGPGVLILGGANTHTGSNIVTAGTLRPNIAAAMGATTTSIIVNPGGTFDVNGINLSTHPFFISGSGAAGIGALVNLGADQISATQNVTMTGNATVGGTGRFDIRGGATLSTNGQPYTLTKVGANQVSLVGANVDAALGDIDIQEGIFGVETSTNRMGDPAKKVTIAAGATLKFYGLNNAQEKVAISNGGRFWTENGGGNTFIGPVTLNATSTFENTGGTTTFFNGPIGGAGGVIKTNTGTTVFGNANTYTGSNTVNAGILTVTSLADGGVPSGLGQSSPAPANLVLAGGAVGYSGTAVASTDRRFTLAGTGGGLDASGAGGAPVTFASTAPIVVSGAGPVTLTLSGTNTDENVLAAQVVNGAGSTAVTKTGAGNWTLSNANSYTGPTTLNNGILRVKSLANGGVASGIGQSTSAPANLVLAGGTLSYVGALPASSDRQFSLLGTGGALDASGAAGAPVVFSSTAPVITPGATLTLRGTNTDANVFAGQLVDGGQQTMLIKDGTGTWTLTGASTHTGTTNVFGGTLRVTGSISTTDVNVNGGATFDAAAAQTLKTLAVQGGGFATVSGAAKKALAVGDHTQSAPLQIFGGKLDLTTNGLIVHHDVNSVDQPLIDMRTQIISGYNASAPGMGDGKWDGNGITSSSIGSTTAIGYAKASELPSGTFFGQTVDASVVARYTLSGDTNLDGAVDFLDLAKLAQSYNSTVSTTTESWWTHGDFNYDGAVDFLDLAKMAQNYNTALPGAPIPGAPAGFEADLARAFANVPEPGAVGLLGLCGAALMTRRRRRP